jgi:hypothetical protein
MKSLTRDAKKVRSHLEVLEDGGVVTRKACTIQVPERYLERHLASVGSEVYILGIFGLIMEAQYYGVMLVDAMVRILPSATETVDIDGISYLEFSFDAGDQLLYSTDLVLTDTLTYYIYDEHVAKGRIPWYLDYFDLAYLFESAKRHAGINLGNRSIIELILSTIARNPQQMMQLYRHILKDATFIKTTPPAVVPFKSVIWNAADTTSKLIGGYFGDSVTSALVNPSEKVERIEALLRA